MKIVIPITHIKKHFGLHSSYKISARIERRHRRNGELTGEVLLRLHGAAGHPTAYLHRSTGSSLNSGEWREINRDEFARLAKLEFSL